MSVNFPDNEAFLDWCFLIDVLATFVGNQSNMYYTLPFIVTQGPENTHSQRDRLPKSNIGFCAN